MDSTIDPKKFDDNLLHDKTNKQKQKKISIVSMTTLIIGMKTSN
jgi:hypothetical protein